MRHSRVVIWLLALIICFSGCDAPINSEAPSTEGLFRLTFIDVGEGNAALIRSPDGKTVLMDAGPQSAYGDVVAELDASDCHHLDAVIATHPHDDHIGALPALLTNYQVDQLFFNGRADTDIYQKVMTLAREKGIPVTERIQGDSVDLGKDVVCRVVGPENTVSGNLNNVSIMLHIRYGDHAFIIIGDAEKEEEAAAVAQYGASLQANVLGVGHHGSSSSTSPAFVAAIKPQVAVISVGENQYGHPDGLVINRLRLAGADVYTTQKSGSVLFESNGTQLWISGRKNIEPVATAA